MHRYSYILSFASPFSDSSHKSMSSSALSHSINNRSASTPSICRWTKKGAVIDIHLRQVTMGHNSTLLFASFKRSQPDVGEVEVSVRLPPLSYNDKHITSGFLFRRLPVSVVSGYTLPSLHYAALKKAKLSHWQTHAFVKKKVAHNSALSILQQEVKLLCSQHTVHRLLLL